MSPYILRCSVCETDFHRRKQWLHHLLGSEHQVKGRQQLFHWDSKTKECVLVAFASFPVGSSDTILSHFSSKSCVNKVDAEGFVEKENEDSLFMVTDFVWFPERPRVAFLQFESRATVDAILALGSSLEVRIDDQLIQLKKATDYMCLEWDLLLPDLKHDAACPSECELDAQSNCDPKLSPVAETSEPPGTADSGPGSRSKYALLIKSLIAEFNSIRRELSIRPYFRDKIYKETRKLKSMFSDRFPAAEAILIRNGYLGGVTCNRLSSNSNDDVIIFLVTHSEYNSSDEEESWVTESLLKEAFNSQKAADLFEGQVIPNDQQFPHSLTFVSNVPRLKFNIITTSSFLPEAQACRLFIFMTKFDSRLRQLHTLYRFWARANDIRFSERTRTFSELPEYYYLDWLLMFFLCHKKLVPTPRQVQEHAHEPLLLDGVDVGFSEDIRHSNEWRSAHPDSDINGPRCFHEVLQLLLDLFRFLETTVFGQSLKGFIVNIRDGDLISKKDVFSKKSGSKTQQQIGRLTKDELEVVRSHKGLKEDLDYTLYLMHPLYVAHSCVLDMDRRRWKRNVEVIAQTKIQLEADLRNCDIVSGKFELSEYFQYRKVLTAGIFLGPNSN